MRGMEVSGWRVKKGKEGAGDGECSSVPLR